MLQVDFQKKTGTIKPLHGVGQPPFSGGFRCLNFTMIRYLQEAGIPYSRLHDVGGAFGGMRYVDIPNLFRDFDADENDPASYDFVFTDLLMQALHDYGVAPVFRLGVTIENQACIKAYRIHPPKDFAKWARICEHVIRHYNEGWANGFHYGVVYWEIWNEPDNHRRVIDNQMWTGTTQQYYDLYTTAALHLKKCFGDSIKIGGYASTGFPRIYDELEKYGLSLPHEEEPTEEQKAHGAYRIDYFKGFLEQVKKTGAPLDFFSWHCYFDADVTAVNAQYVRKVLDEYGFEKTESHLNEWNNAHEKKLVGTSFAAASAAAMLINMQNVGLDVACYYDARYGVGSYAGFFNFITGQPVATYYAFKAFNELYKLKNQTACSVDEEGLYAAAAEGDGKKAVMIASLKKDHTTDLSDLDGMSAYLIEKDVFLEKVAFDAAKPFEIKENQTYLFTNYAL